MSTTDALKRLIIEHLERLRPVLDGPPTPAGVHIHGQIAPDGTMKQLEIEPRFRMYGERR